jgi:streptogramin lyase
MTKRNRPRLRFERLEDRCVLSGISSITEFPLSSPSGNAISGITAGPDGNLWFTDKGGSDIGMINPTTHAISLFPTPTAGAFPRGITAGPDGNLWFTEDSANKIGEINPTTHAIAEFALPTNASGGHVNYPYSITAGPDGNLWFASTGTGQGAIGEISPTTHAISYYPVNFSPVAITAGPDGNLWFYGGPGERGDVGEISPTTHAITTFAAPYSAMGAITTGSDGNLWFTDEGASELGMINPRTDVVSEYSAPAYSVGITSGPDGNLWSTEPSVGQIASLNPTTDAATAYPIPYAGSDPIAIATGPDGNLWFTDNGTNSIGVATLTSSQLVVTTQPPPIVTAGTPFSLTVQAENASGNVISSFNGTVTVALANNPGGTTLGGTLTATATNGVATFSGLTLTKAASGYTLDVSASGLGAGGTSAITVTPSAPTQVVVTTQPPSSVTAGSGFGLTAAIEDMYGNVVTSDSNSVGVALASGPSGATLGGTLSATASDGVATFSGLSLTKAASGYTLQVSSAGLSSSVSNALTVTPGAAVGLLIAQQPTSVVVNAGFTIVVEAVDAYGNLVTSDNDSVTVALGNGPSGAKLGGTKSMKFVNGVATFSGLTLNKVGTGYTILISSKNLTGATTNPIDVTAS